MKIGIDVDNVLRAIMPTIEDIYERDYGERVPTSRIVTYGLENYMTKITDPKQFFIDNAEDIFLNSPMNKNAKKVVDYLRQDNEVIINTAQHPGLEELTLKWLHEKGIKYDSIYFGWNKDNVKMDYLIDDCIRNLDGTEAKGIAYGMPWNQNYNTRVKNWNEVARYFKNATNK